VYGRKIGEKLAICPLFAHFYFKSGQAETLAPQGLIVIRYYLALRGAENGVTAMVTPFFCVQG